MSKILGYSGYLYLNQVNETTELHDKQKLSIKVPELTL